MARYIYFLSSLEEYGDPLFCLDTLEKRSCFPGVTHWTRNTNPRETFEKMEGHTILGEFDTLNNPIEVLYG